MRFIFAGLLLLAAGTVYNNYGTLEPCGILRENLRRQTIRAGGDFGGFLAAVIPDSALNAFIAAQYNRPVTPMVCIGILLGADRPPTQPSTNRML